MLITLSVAGHVRALFLWWPHFVIWTSASTTSLLVFASLVAQARGLRARRRAGPSPDATTTRRGALS